jgi:predicted glycosyltransferase
VRKELKILLDISHPAHAHFFRHPIGLLQENGHRILVTSRKKEIATKLLDGMKIQHQVLSSEGSGGVISLAKELYIRNRALLSVVKWFKPDVMAAIGGIFIAQVGWISRTPSVIFYDTENAKLQNVLTYPFASVVVAPRAYQSWLPSSNIRYSGYHELSYLHPDNFQPNYEIAVRNGLAEIGDTFFLRLVAWKANHDIGEKGWNTSLLRKLVSKLNQYGQVLISSEAPLPDDLRSKEYSGDPNQVHHVLAFSRLFVGESATMASECAVLGIPAIYAAHTGRGYTDEQESRFGLVCNLHDFHWEKLETAVDVMLNKSQEEFSERRQNLLNETIAVAPFVASCIQDWRGVKAHQENTQCVG